jgi:hypothetical protein
MAKLATADVHVSSYFESALGDAGWLANGGEHATRDGGEREGYKELWSVLSA